MTQDLGLVLSGGGARAAYQAGTLRAMAEIAPDAHFPIITGVSAGAINTLCLAATPGSLADAASALEAQWRRLTPDQVYRARPVKLARGAIRLLWDALIGRRSGPPATRGLLDMSPLRTFLGEAVDLEGIARNLRDGHRRAVALSATSYTTGWTISFVQADESVAMWTRAQRAAVRASLTFDHVLASAAIPLVFPAVPIGAEFFGDGSVRQGAPLAPAIHLGAGKVVAIGMRRRRHPAVPARRDAEHPSVAEVAGLLLHAIFLDALDADAERLERLNALLEHVPASVRERQGLRKIALLHLHPSRDLGVMARDYPLELPPLLRMVIRAMGGERARAADFMSYLHFEPAYTGDLMQLGYEDTLARRDDIERFLEEETG